MGLEGCHCHRQPAWGGSASSPVRLAVGLSGGLFPDNHILSSKGNLEVERSTLEDLLEMETLHKWSDPAADMVHADWQEQVDVLQALVKCLKGMIKN